MTPRERLESKLIAAKLGSTPKFMLEAAELISEQNRCLVDSDLVLDCLVEDEDMYPQMILRQKVLYEQIDPTVYILDGCLTLEGRSFFRAILNEVQEMRRSLRALNDDEFLDVYRRDILIYHADAQSRRKQRGASRDKWEEFNDPSFDADYSYWGIAPVWTEEESIVLSLGKDPDHVDRKSVGSPGPRGSLFRDKFDRRSKLVSLAIEAGDLSEPIRPKNFVEWAINIGFELPQALKNILPSSRAIQREVSTPDIHQNTLHMFYRILLGVLVKDYGFDFSKPDTDDQPGVFVKIENALIGAGVSVDAKTIRKHARRAQKWADAADLPIATRLRKKPTT
ncbi:hypothetical protein [Lichenifustis flavocetrariae]|uniref:Uncharacterized protein n=1 Tax=Lichenifustis flavocetrariae TaxID=2949735 RepID=A0AA41YUN5_9HYPH|nr:hypothetical protein [Lichenifustis flavocetrariae]MCW6508454.1 hypothetical protein [Lichenifustis flavocetrariae]